MELPKASRTVKRTIDLVHLFAASVWLGGFAVLFVLTLSDGAALGFKP
jgi:putative copper export protein